MKASEVLIKNEKGRKQIMGQLRDDQYGYCAIGALACELNIPINPGDVMISVMQLECIAQTYGITFQLGNPIPCPVCGNKEATRFPLYLIPHLNDQHRWTFVEIGEWLKQFEK